MHTPAIAVLAVLSVAADPPVAPGQHWPKSTTVRLGGSLGLDLSALARSSSQGLQLLAEHVNATGRFECPSLGKLKLMVQLEDDKGDAHRVEDIYHRMADTDQVDFFISPYPAHLSRVAAEVSNATGKLAMMFGAVPPDLYQHGFRTVFTMNVVAPDYMSHALEVLQLMGVRTVALVWEATAFDLAVCGGAAEHARRLGLTVKEQFQLMEDNIMTQVLYLKARGPDVLVGCGQIHTAVQLVVSARALSFSPQAMVLSIGSAMALVNAVGASNANYIMSPVSWVPYLNLSCPVFGTTKGFVDAYNKRWNEAPTYQSAAAAASGIAILAAIEAAGTLEPEAVRSAMLRLDVQTFYASLSFHGNGTRRGARMLTQQVQPLDSDRPPVERWVESKIVSVGPRSPPLWPMPAWDQKEIEIYPCPPGEVWIAKINETGNEHVKCEECSAGRYRHPRSVICEVCEAGQYGTSTGMSQCEVCPEGASCPEGFRSGRPNATAGYYKMPMGELMLLQCNPKELCLGGNNCSGHNTGILCEQCEPGYTRKYFMLGRKTCTACHSHTWNIFTIILTALLYTLYTWVIVKATLSASKSIRAIHSVILKICVNYLQFAGTAFEATEFKSMVKEICGHRAAYVVPFITLPEILQFPFASLGSPDCLLADYGISLYEACIIVGLSLMPVAFLVKTLFAFVRKEFVIRRLCPWLRKRWQRLRARCRARPAEPSPGRLASTSSEKVPSLDLLGIPVASPSLTPGTPRRRAGSTPASCAAGSPQEVIQEADAAVLTLPSTQTSALSPLGPSVTSPSGRIQRRLPSARSLQFSGSSPIHRTMTAFANSSFVTRFVNSSIVMSFVLHPVVVRLLVVGFECVDLDVLRQKHNLDVTCASAEHTKWLMASVIGLVTFGLGTPVVLYWMLWRKRNHLLQDDVCKRFGFLYNGFEMRYYFFESVYMFRKVVIQLFFTFPTMYLRTVLMLFISWAFILLHLRYQPFDNRSYLCLARLEGMNLRALTVTVTARLVFDIRRELSGHFLEKLAKHWAVDALLIVLPLFFHAWFVAFAVWSLLRNTVLKHLSLKADVWPERLTRFQRLCLLLDWRQHKACWTYNGGHLQIDTSELSSKERQYLFVALHDTLHRCMDSKIDVHLGFIEETVHNALRDIRISRRSKAVRIMRLHRQEAEKPSWWRTLIRWRGELSLSLDGPMGREAPTPEEVEKTSCGAICKVLDDFIKFLEHGQWPQEDAQTASMDLSPYDEARHRHLERSNDFTAEELYDALLPLWRYITDQNCKSSLPVPEEQSSMQRLSHSNSFSELMGRQEQTSEHSKDSDDSEDNVAGNGHKGMPRLGSFNAVENLLGLSPSARQQAGPISEMDSDETMLQQAAQPCQIEVPILLRQHEQLLSENLQLRSENESLRQQVTTAARAAPIAIEERKAAAEALSQREKAADSSELVPPAGAAEARTSESPSLQGGPTETSEVPSLPTAANVDAHQPAAQPARAAGSKPIVSSASRCEGNDSAGADRTSPAAGMLIGQDDDSLQRPVNSCQDSGGTSKRHTAAPSASSLGPSPPQLVPPTPPRAPPITLPGVGKRCVQQGSPRKTRSGGSSEDAAARDRARSSGPPAVLASMAVMSTAWSSAMQPTDPSVWQKQQPCDFIQAGRPTSHGNWPRLDAL